MRSIRRVHSAMQSNVSMFVDLDCGCTFSKKSTRGFLDGHIELLHADTSSRVLGSCFEVYRIRGYGFLENVYKGSVAVELGLRGASVRREVPVKVDYKG